MKNLKMSETPRKIRVFWSVEGWFDFTPPPEWNDFDEIGRRTEVEQMFQYKLEAESGFTQLPEMSYEEIY